MTLLANYFKQRRLELGLRLGDVAMQIGYADLGKGAGRINKFEKGGKVHRDLMVKLAKALNIDSDTVEKLIDEDRRRFFLEWNHWANETIKPFLVVRVIPAVYVSEKLPQEAMTLDEAEAFASERARHWKRCCCLVFTRRLSIWIKETGEIYERTEAVPGEPNTPYMRLGRSKKSFLVRNLSRQDFVRAAGWPAHPEPKGKDKETTWD